MVLGSRDARAGHGPRGGHERRLRVCLVRVCGPDCDGDLDGDFRREAGFDGDGDCPGGDEALSTEIRARSLFQGRTGEWGT
jgi:hypothetical protein